MQRQEEQRVTQRLESAELLDVGAVNGAPGMQEDEESVTLAELADPQGADDPAATPAPAATSDPLALPSDDPELVRIREILVGPHLRDHERRLRLVWQRDAERAVVAMQAERQHLAGLLAELGLHLIRHAASPAAQAEQATEILSVRLSETDPAAGS